MTEKELREGIADVILKSRIRYPEQADGPEIHYCFNALFLNEVLNEILALIKKLGEEKE